MREKKSVAFVFLGSESVQEIPEHRKTEKLLKRERKLYRMYLNIKERPTIMKLDQRRVKGTFQKWYKKYFDLTDIQSVPEIKKKLKKIFKMKV